ncbi:MAG: class I SAM-dependent methyltransferase [Planctomycetota bacterium]
MCSHHARHAHRLHALLLILALTGVAALALLAHGVSWWYAPLGAGAVVAVHLALFAGLAAAARGVTRAGHGPAGHGHDGSLVLHGARGYDWFVRAFTMGREGKLRRWALDQGALKPGSSVLDVGSGTGTLLIAAAGRVGPSGNLQGVELSPEMCARARDKAKRRGVALTITETPAEKLPFPPATFDAAFCTLVLHHMPVATQEAAIREMRRVLKPGGRIVLVDWRTPKSFFRTLFDGMGLVYLMHRHGPSPLETGRIEPLLAELGLEDLSHPAYGGGAIGAIVARAGVSRTE